MSKLEKLNDQPQALTDNLSVLDLLSPEQMEELQDMAERGDETPTVSQRLSQMIQAIAGNNPSIQRAMEEAKASAVDKFTNLLATPLSELAKDVEFDSGEDME